MKKLITIIASALTLGAFADAADTPIIVTGLDTAGITNGSTLTLVHDGEEIVSTTYNGESSMTFGTEGDGTYVVTCDGTPVIEEIANTRGSAPKFASVLPKMVAANVGDTVTWSNTDTTNNGGNLAWGSWELCLRAQEGMPAGSTVALSSIQIAMRSDDLYPAPAFKIIIPGGTDAVSAAAVDGGTMNINAKETPDTRNSKIYMFDPAVALTVGVTYELKAANADGTVLADRNNGGATGVNTGVKDWAVRWSNQTGWMPVAIVTGKFTAEPARDPENFVFDASAQTWTPSTPEEFLLGDTVSYTGEGDATLSMDVPCELTVGAGVNLSVSGDVNISGKSKFAAGSTLTIASGTTTISNAQSGRSGQTDRGLMGTIVIESGATLSVPKNDSIDYNGTTKMVVKGTFNGGAARQTFNANNTIELHNGAKIEGTGAAYGQVYTAVLDINQNATFTVNGTAAINAPVGIREVTLTIKKAEDATSASVTLNADNKILGPGAIVYEGISGMEKLPAKYATQGGKKITLKDCTGWINWSRFDGEVTISGTFTINNGSSTTAGTIKTLKGDGTIAKDWANVPKIYIEEHTAFTGSVTAEGVHLSRAKSESAYYYTIDAVKAAVNAGTEVTNIDCTAEELGDGYEIVDGKIVKTETYPGAIAGGSEDQQSEYVAWAAANNVTGSTAEVLADAFAVLPNAEGLANEEAILKAAQDELVEILATLDLTTITTDASFPIEGYPNASFKFVEASLGEGVTTNAKLFKLSVSFKPANGEQN